jgi:hypothetical protein
VLGSEEHAVDVDLHDSAPDLRIFVDHAALAGDAHVVVQQVESAKLRERGFDHRAALGVLGHVDGIGRGDSAFLRDHLDRPPREVELPVHDQNARACAGQQDGGRSTVTNAVSRGPAARNYGHLACEPEVLPSIRSQVIRSQKNAPEEDQAR